MTSKQWINKPRRPVTHYWTESDCISLQTRLAYPIGHTGQAFSAYMIRYSLQDSDFIPTYSDLYRMQVQLVLFYFNIIFVLS